MPSEGGEGDQPSKSKEREKKKRHYWGRLLGGEMREKKRKKFGDQKWIDYISSMPEVLHQVKGQSGQWDNWPCRETSGWPPKGRSNQ